MKATFKPTNYQFQFEDTYFVEAVYSDGSQKCIAATEEFNHAKLLAEAILQRSSVKAVYVFTRTHQHLTLQKHELAAA
jgi:predicted dehydrogenase